MGIALVFFGLLVLVVLAAFAVALFRGPDSWLFTWLGKRTDSQSNLYDGDRYSPR